MDGLEKMSADELLPAERAREEIGDTIRYCRLWLGAGELLTLGVIIGILTSPCDRGTSDKRYISMMPTVGRAVASS